ncbi:MAG: hypothetical protein M3442_21050 [Chloroflexota bacterium]|nr:hypothetical protein [Chloroflexota bacterium]
MEDPAVFALDRVRFEVLRHFGYFVTESSTHMAEYVPYFLKDSAEIERLQIRTRTGESFASQRASREEAVMKALREEAGEIPEIRRSNEYAARIIHAIETDTPATIVGNVPNTGLMTNLLNGACVEVPCLVDGAGLQPCYIGDLPPQCAGLCQSNVAMQHLAVRALVEGNREHVYHAAMLDPNTASQLTLPAIRKTIDRLLDAQRELMPTLA